MAPKLRLDRRSVLQCGTSLLLPLYPFFARAQQAPSQAAEAFVEVCSRVLDLPFDAAQQQQIRNHLNAYWRAHDKRAMGAVVGTVQFLQQLRQQPPALASVALRMTRPSTLRNFAGEAARGDALAAWMLQHYHQRHPVLAEGKPDGLPLTRDSVDGSLDIALFMATEIHHQPARVPSSAERDQAYRAATARHPALSAEQQFVVGQAPGEAARLRYGWQHAGALDRLLARSELGARLTPHEQQQVQQFLGGLQGQLQGLQAQQHALLNGALANMRQNSELIMGRGTVWNPTTNRWEQQGGIVTEFNGTVRVQ